MKKKDEEEINESKKGELRIRQEKKKQQQIKLVVCFICAEHLLSISK